LEVTTTATNNYNTEFTLFDKKELGIFARPPHVVSAILLVVRFWAFYIQYLQQFGGADPVLEHNDGTEVCFTSALDRIVNHAKVQPQPGNTTAYGDVAEVV
jgi:hypothetical protein